MKEIIPEILKRNTGPFLFLLIAGLLCLTLPEDARVEAVYLVIGAALTRVKRTDAK